MSAIPPLGCLETRPEGIEETDNGYYYWAVPSRGRFADAIVARQQAASPRGRVAASALRDRLAVEFDAVMATAWAVVITARLSG
jgi:hypothetical protein